MQSSGEGCVKLSNTSCILLQAQHIIQVPPVAPRQWCTDPRPPAATTLDIHGSLATVADCILALMVGKDQCSGALVSRHLPQHCLTDVFLFVYMQLRRLHLGTRGYTQAGQCNGALPRPLPPVTVLHNFGCSCPTSCQPLLPASRASTEIQRSG